MPLNVTKIHRINWIGRGEAISHTQVFPVHLYDLFQVGICREFPNVRNCQSMGGFLA